MSAATTFPSQPAQASFAAPAHRNFYPYEENGGTILAIAGKHYCVIAGDTRQTRGYDILTRYASKVFRLTDKAVLAVNGFAADGNMFVKMVKQRLEWYRHAHAKDMPLRAIARLIQTMLYSRRFFPYYVYNILGGIDDDGTGAVYSFDPVGSYQREECRSAGAAQSLIQPFLDNQVMFKNQQPPVETVAQPVLGRALALSIDSFTGATERHIEVGDSLEMFVVVSREVFSDTGLADFTSDELMQTLTHAAGGMADRVRELTSSQDGERVFVVRVPLKLD